MKEFQLGVLFVHGIGTQPPRDTLVRWGDVLLKVIGRATEEEPGRTIPIVGRADAGDRSGDKPAEVAVEFRCNDRDQKEKWLLAEGWWADSFPAPTYSELVSWSFRAVPWAIALHIAQRFWQRNPKASKGAWLLGLREGHHAVARRHGLHAGVHDPAGPDAGVGPAPDPGTALADPVDANHAHRDCRRQPCIRREPATGRAHPRPHSGGARAT